MDDNRRRPRFSVMIPARNEEAYIGSCLQSVRRAALPYAGAHEIIVCLNRCTDRTGEVAVKHGARLVHDDSKCLSRIRNTAAGTAIGEILVFIDADSVMTRNLLMEVDLALRNPGIVGGGVWIRPERVSLGIALTGLLLLPHMMLYLGISCGCFWCRREDFLAVNGFDENMLSAEDIDFACRLKAYGLTRGMRFATLYRAYITTSCRKFDKFGDWYALRNLTEMISLLRGRNREAADRIWYDCER